MPKKPVFGAFNQGEHPTIACFNKATVPLGVSFDALIKAMQKYLDNYVAPVWGTPARLIKTTGFKEHGPWSFSTMPTGPDRSRIMTSPPDGLPQSKVFVKTTLQNHDLVSVSASHELVEMLVDPAINLMTTGPDPKTIYG